MEDSWQCGEVMVRFVMLLFTLQRCKNCGTCRREEEPMVILLVRKELSVCVREKLKPPTWNQPTSLTLRESCNILSFLLFGLLSLSSAQFFKIASNRTPIISLREWFHGSVLHWKGIRGTGEMECSSIPPRAATDISACVIYDTASQNRCFENIYFLQAWNSISLLSRTAAKGKEFLGFSSCLNIKWVLM